MMKIKQFINRALVIFNRLTILVDIVVISVLIDLVGSKENKSEIEGLFYYGLIALLIILLYRYIRAWVHIVKSMMDRTVYLQSNRVIAVCGKQRVGKTSLALYFSKATKKLYSNIPMRLKGKYTNKLTTDILTLKTRIEDGSMLTVDEANLFYNNSMSNEDRTLYGQALLCQCVGHFFDGNILYIATDVNRMPKIIRDEWSTKLQVIRSRSYRYSIFGDLLMKTIYHFTNGEPLKYTGVRLWECQQYEKIEEEQYISILGQLENDNRFAPFYIFADFQTIGVTEYDDRYMQAYYLERPLHQDEKWKDLQLNKEDFNTLYDGLMSKYIKYLENEKPSNNKKHFKE